MSTLEELLGKLPDRMYTSKKNDNHIFTPFNVAKEMVEALPDDTWNSQTTFLDICCKSGIFLYLIYEKLMNSSSMIEEIPDKETRRQYILEKQLFGICPDNMCELASTRTVYGYITEDSNIISLDNNYTNIMTNVDKSFLYGTLERKFNMKKFGVVIGNPPYNRGGDIDFVDLGFELCDKYTCMITPAKWQTAEADQKIASKMSYGEFRQKIVPHMSKVVFYPDCLDIFGISQADGITWYILDKKNNKHVNSCTITTKSNLQPIINSTNIRDISHRQTLWNIGQEIIDYLGDYNKFKFEYIYKEKGYTININTQLMQSLTASGAWDWNTSCIKSEYIGKGGFLFNQNGQLLVLNKTRLLRLGEKSTVSASKDVFTSNDIEECKSFYSWINSKFTRFFILINISSLTILNDNTFRFVPAPPSGKFDHIYTDEELYKAFNLPQKYIDVIEVVIKERK